MSLEDSEQGGRAGVEVGNVGRSHITEGLVVSRGSAPLHAFAPNCAICLECPSHSCRLENQVSHLLPKAPPGFPGLPLPLSSLHLPCFVHVLGG